MLGIIHRRRLLAPVLFGSMLTGGCQFLGLDSPSAKSGTFDGKIPMVEQYPGSPDAPAAKPNDGAPGPQSTADRGNLTANTVSSANEAKTVHYISPNATVTVADTPAAKIGNATRVDAGNAGARMPNPAPSDSRGDRDVELAMKVNAGGSDPKSLDSRIQQMEQRLEQRDRAVRQTGADVQAATDELQKTRAEIATQRREVSEMRAKLHNRDKEDIENLKATIKMLEQLLGEDACPIGQE